MSNFARKERTMNRNPHQSIIRVATECFLKYGIKGTTMNIVAAGTGISKRTLYQCFPDKRDLLKTCMHNRFEADLRTIRERIVGMGTLEAILFLNRMAYDLFTAPYPAFCRDLVCSRDLTEFLRTEYREPLEAIAAMLLDRAKAEGVIAAEADTSKSFSLFEKLLSSLEEEPCDDRERAAAFSYAVRICLAGLCTDRGREQLKNIHNNE